MSQNNKLFVNREGKTTFTCPQCSRSKSIDVSGYIKKKKAIRVKCKCTCGYTGVFLLDRRDQYRKKTSLLGAYFLNREEIKASDLPGIDYFYHDIENNKKIEVTNLSRTGLRLRTKEPHKLNLGDIITVDFFIDDKEKSFISKKVKVMNIDEKNVGAEFCSLAPSDKAFKAINFYLFNS